MHVEIKVNYILLD